MPTTLNNSAVSSHRLLPEKSQGQAKVEIRNPDIQSLREVWREHVGSAVVRVRQVSGLSLKEFAATVGRDERQVSRWENGSERPHFDALYAVPALRPLLAIAMSELAGAGVELETVIRVKRSA